MASELEKLEEDERWAWWEQKLYKQALSGANHAIGWALDNHAPAVAALDRFLQARWAGTELVGYHIDRAYARAREERAQRRAHLLHAGQTRPSDSAPPAPPPAAM